MDVLKRHMEMITESRDTSFGKQKINESAEGALEALSFFTSKKGKYTNAKINKMLKEQGYSSEVQPIGYKDMKKIIYVLTDWNFHAYSRMAELLVNKKPKHAEWMIELLNAQEKDGFLEDDISSLRFMASEGDFRDRQVRGMKKMAMGTASHLDNAYNPKTASARFWKILKKHPEKDLVKEIESFKKLEPAKIATYVVSVSAGDKKKRMALGNEIHNLGRRIRKENRDADDVKFEVEMKSLK